MTFLTWDVRKLEQKILYWHIFVCLVPSSETLSVLLYLHKNYFCFPWWAHHPCVDWLHWLRNYTDWLCLRCFWAWLPGSSVIGLGWQLLGCFCDLPLTGWVFSVMCSSTVLKVTHDFPICKGLCNSELTVPVDCVPIYLVWLGFF